jgi:hypothetical protein
LLASASSALAVPRLGHLVPISLHAGVNRISHFMPDGRDAQIIRAWRENGNAHGYEVFLILVPTKRGGSDWNVIGFDRGKSFDDEITYAPHTGEDVSQAVRFVWTSQAGKRTPLVVKAARQIATSYADPSVTTVTVYSLRRSDGVFGTTTDYFGVLNEWKAGMRYCNAELALRDEVGLPLPSDYAGPNKIDGCYR